VYLCGSYDQCYILVSDGLRHTIVDDRKYVSHRHLCQCSYKPQTTLKINMTLANCKKNCFLRTLTNFILAANDWNTCHVNMVCSLFCMQDHLVGGRACCHG